MPGQRVGGVIPALVGFAAAIVVLVATATPTAAGDGVPAPTVGAVGVGALASVGPWQQVDQSSRLTITSGQGPASITTGGHTTIVYRGNGSIPPRLYLQGWRHVGDPGGHDGYLFDAYQGAANARAKLYEVTTPGGSHLDYVHPLAPGEAMNNSFAAVSPDGQWMVSGEWGTMSRLLVFPAPLLNPEAATPGVLAQVGTIALDHPMRNVQGCDFVAAARLVCSTDDPGTDLYPTPRQLLQVDLPAGGLTGRPATAATVSSLGALPMQSACAGTFETEGIDYAPTGELRVEVIPPEPCSAYTTVYVYRHG